MTDSSIQTLLIHFENGNTGVVKLEYPVSPIKKVDIFIEQNGNGVLQNSLTYASSDVFSEV